MRSIVVVGAGAVGSYFGGRLAQGGATVSVVCRSDYDTVKQRGITVKSCDGDFQFTPTCTLAHDEPPNCPAYYYVIVAMKVLPHIDVPATIRDFVGPHTAILLLQNGIDIEASVARAFPENEVISGLAFICVSRTAPGVVHHQDHGRIVLGRYPAGRSSRVTALQRSFEAAGVPCRVSTDILTDRWAKLLWNAPYNTLSVLAGGVTTKEIMDDPALSVLVRQIMLEIRTIAAAYGCRIDMTVVDKHVEDTRTMRPYKTSMLLDFEAGRPLEVEAILGNALRMAAEKALPTPKLDVLYPLLATIDRAQRQ